MASIEADEDEEDHTYRKITSPEEVDGFSRSKNHKERRHLAEADCEQRWYHEDPEPVTDGKQLTLYPQMLREDDRHVGCVLQQLFVPLETKDLETAHQPE